MAYVESVVDLDEILVGETYFPQDYNNGVDPFSRPVAGDFPSMASERFIHHFLMDDDIAEFVDGTEDEAAMSWVRYQAAATFYWQRDPYVNAFNATYEMNSWTDYYARIAACNSVLFQLDEMRAKETNDTLEMRVEAEARFLRAAYYFMLVNAYAQPYNVESAATEPGVPLKTSEVIEDHYFARNSVAEVYEQMVEDLKRSVTCFRDITPFARPIRANYAAAATLLSRVYLYMEEYEQAVAYADSAIAFPGFGILDLNTHPMTESFSSLSSVETLFSQRGSFVSFLHQSDSLDVGSVYQPRPVPYGNFYTASDDLLACYAETDLRRQAFFVPRFFNTDTYRCLKVRRLSDDVVGEDHVIRLPEAYLNKAEALAILGRDDEAKTTLMELLRNRYAPGDVPSLTMGGVELVQYIRDERRRELCYEGHRWFDLRRYAVNSRYPYTKAIEHVSYEYVPTSEEGGYFRAIGKYVLNPYPEDKNAYVLPLPSFAVEFNEGVMIQNPERPERELQPLS